MAASAGPDIVEDGLVLYLDAENVDGFPDGEPTVNLVRKYYDFSSNDYALQDEYAPTPSAFLKTYIPDISTPVGIGATLISEDSGSESYYRYLSRFGGGSESRKHCVSCYVYPVSGSFSSSLPFSIGLVGDGGNIVRFNFETMTVTHGSGILNKTGFIERVDGWDGWYRVGANIDGRFGGWVGSIGFNTNAPYIPPNPSRSFYATGLQYEYKVAPTPFVAGTRNTWYDLSGNGNNGTLYNSPNFAIQNKKAIKLDGVNDYFTIPHTPEINTDSFTIEVWVDFSQESEDTFAYNLFDTLTSYGGIYEGIAFGADTTAVRFRYARNDSNAIRNRTASYNFSLNIPYLITLTKTESSVKMYINGSSIYSTSTTEAINFNSQLITSGRNRYNGAQHFNGNLYSLKFYKKDFTQEEIQQNYNATKSRFYDI